MPPSVPIAEVYLSALLAAAPSDEDAQAMANSALEGIRDIEQTIPLFPHAGRHPYDDSEFPDSEGRS